jgi:hypothetical protein
MYFMHYLYKIQGGNTYGRAVCLHVSFSNYWTNFRQIWNCGIYTKNSEIWCSNGSENIDYGLRGYDAVQSVRGYQDEGDTILRKFVTIWTIWCHNSEH